MKRRSQPVWLNLSTRELTSACFVIQLLERLQHQDPPIPVGIDVAEQSLLTQAERARPALEKLRAQGVALALEDFGGAEASLTQLQRLKPTLIKTHRALLTDVPDGPDAVRIPAERGPSKGRVFFMDERWAHLDHEGDEVHRGINYGIRKGAQHHVDNAREIDAGTAERRIGGRLQTVRIATRITEGEAERLRREQVAAAPATETRKEQMLVGAILPIWDRVQGSETIYRLKTDEGEQLRGRRLDARAAEQTLKPLTLHQARAVAAAVRQRRKGQAAPSLPAAA